MSIKMHQIQRVNWYLVSPMPNQPLFLTGKKWKKVNLAEFAKDFKMQEMEKQAYLLSKVGIFPWQYFDTHLCIPMYSIAL